MKFINILNKLVKIIYGKKYSCVKIGDVKCLNVTVL